MKLKAVSSMGLDLHMPIEKRHYFYYTIPSDSEDTDGEESDLECGLDELDEEIEEKEFELVANMPSIWFFNENTSENSQSFTSSQDKVESDHNSDNEDLNCKGFPRLQSREYVPKSDDTTVFGDTPPKEPSRIRFNDTPEIIYYEQVTEFEAGVYDYRYEEFLRMKNKCENRITSAPSCQDSDNEETRDDIAFVAVVDKRLKPSCTECGLPEEEIKKETGIGFNCIAPEKRLMEILASCICGRSGRVIAERGGTFDCNNVDVGDRMTEETSGVSCDDLEESTGKKSGDSMDDCDNFSDDYNVDNNEDRQGEKCNPGRTGNYRIIALSL